MEFRFGIHNIHLTITHLSVTGVLGTSVQIAIIMSKRNYFSRVENDFILRIVISSFRGCLWV